MLETDVQSAVELVGRIFDNLLETGQSSGREGSDLRRIVGEKRSAAEASIRSGDIGSELLECFTQARLAGSTLSFMAGVRSAIEGETVSSALLSVIISAGILISLTQEAIIITETKFRSRDDIEAALTQSNDAFNRAKDLVADQRDAATYQALIALHASVTRHLVDQSISLPRVIHFNFPQSMPALTLANRVYGDGGRADELLDENKTIHPLFMSGQGRALSD